MERIYNSLYGFQKDVVDICRNRNKYGIFFEMGLGKTRTSLAIMQERKAKNIIILCQMSKLLDWEKECKKWFGDSKEIIVFNSRQNKNKYKKIAKSNGEFILIMKFTSAWRMEQELIENGVLGFETNVIFDESQNMKAPKGKLGNFMFELSQVVKSLYLLSGTPWSNSQLDLFNQLRSLGWEIEYKEFQDRFLNTIQISPTGKYMIDIVNSYNPNKNKKELKRILYQYAILKSTEEVGIQLPDQTFIDINLKFENKVYEETENNRFFEKEDEDIIVLETPLTALTFLRQLASGSYKEEKRISNHKTKALIDLLESNNENLIVFYNFTQELEEIKEIIKEKKIDIKVFECNGNNKNYTTRHNYTTKRQIILIQYLSGATGIELHDFKYVVFYSPTLSSQIYQQALKRVHRIGQKDNCFYYRFITEDTVEEKIYRTLAKGQDYTALMFEKEMKDIWDLFQKTHQ